MRKRVRRGATTLITLAELRLLLAVIGGLAFVTRTGPPISEQAAKAILGERPGK